MSPWKIYDLPIVQKQILYTHKLEASRLQVKLVVQSAVSFVSSKLQRI